MKLWILLQISEECWFCLLFSQVIGFGSSSVLFLEDTEGCDLWLTLELGPGDERLLTFPGSLDCVFHSPFHIRRQFKDAGLG